MVPRPLVILLALLTSSAALTGCIGKGGDSGGATVDPAETNETPPTTLPDGREFAAGSETNKTERGSGGVKHEHDYWQGKESITIYDKAVSPQLTPLFERGDNTKLFIAYVNLDKLPGTEDQGEDAPDALVYEGTGRVDFTITSAPAWADSFEMTYRSAGSDWIGPTMLKVGETFTYEPSKTETDMPHSFRSLWNWKLIAKSPVPVTGDLFFTDQPIKVTIVVTKARNVDDWPGHPAFYDGVNERVVAFEKQGKTNVQQAADVLVYGVEPDQIVPDRLISMGTRYLDVYVNITRLEMPPGVESDGFSMFWRAANTPPDALGYNPGNNDTDGTTWAYWHLTLKDDEVDSPYQPESRFTFKVLANPANSDVARCYRCIPYTIEYTMTIIARPDPNEVPVSLDEE